MKLKTKLISIFVIITVVPILSLTLMVQDHSNNILLFVLGKLDKFSSYSYKATKNTNNDIMKDSLKSLDLKSKKHLENISKNTAKKISNFLYSIDRDLLFLSNIDIYSKNLLEKFFNKKTKSIVKPMNFKFYEEIGEWVADEIYINSEYIIENNSSNNKEKITFHHYKDFDMMKKKIYKEVSFIDLKGIEKLKISSIDKKLKNISKRVNTYAHSENYFDEIKKLSKGEIYVSNIIGEYVGSKIDGAFTKKSAKKIGIKFEPKKYGYAGIENPLGKKFDGIIRFITPKYEKNKKVGYISLALDFIHISNLLDYIAPQLKSYNNYSDASKGNIAFMWDNQLRMASHPRDYYVSGFNKDTGKRVKPWLSSDVAKKFRDSNKSWEEFSKVYPKYENQSVNKKADLYQLEVEGEISLDCEFLNFNSQCSFFKNATKVSGYSSFSYTISGEKIFSATATIPYYSGQYKKNNIGFGAVVVQSNFKDFRKDVYKVRDTINNINDLYQNQIHIFKTRINNSVLSMINSKLSNLFLISVIIIILLIMVVVFVSNYLTYSINKVIKGVRQFQEHGYKNLDSEIKINSKDEIAELAESFNDMAFSINELFIAQEKLNKTLDDKVKQKTKEVTRLLSNSDQGFLTFGRNLLINKEYSKKCESILGANIEGENISTILFSTEEKINSFRENVYATLDAKNNISKEALISLFPKELNINEKTINIKYKLLENTDFMLILTDITYRTKLNIKIKKEKSYLKMIVNIVKDYDLFFDLKKDFEYFSSTNKFFFVTNESYLRNINEIYREVHTFKGIFSQFFMDDTVHKLHLVESDISSMIEDSTKKDNKSLIAFLENTDFLSFAKDDLKNIQHTLGDNYFTKDSILSISKDAIINMQKKYQDIILKHNIYTDDSSELDSNFHNLFNKDIKIYLRFYPKMMIELANKFKKQIYELDIKADHNILVSEEYKGFLYSLVHVFKNSIEHGIEKDEERKELGKDISGSISCFVSAQNKNITITISDDGRGIDIKKLKEKILKQYPDKEISKLSDNDIYQFIFEDQISTMDEVSETSGRGVGMSAVKSEINKINGKIEIKSKINVGTTFIFTIPREITS